MKSCPWCHTSVPAGDSLVWHVVEQCPVTAAVFKRVGWRTAPMRLRYKVYKRYRQARYLWTIVARWWYLHISHRAACRSCAGWGFEKDYNGEVTEWDNCGDCVKWGLCSVCGRYNPWSLMIFSMGATESPIGHSHNFHIYHDMERCNYCGADYTGRVHGAPGGLPEEWGQRRERGLKWA